MASFRSFEEFTRYLIFKVVLFKVLRHLVSLTYAGSLFALVEFE